MIQHDTTHIPSVVDFTIGYGDKVEKWATARTTSLVNIGDDFTKPSIDRPLSSGVNQLERILSYFRSELCIPYSTI